MSSLQKVVVPLWPGSDGDATHVPPIGLYTQLDPPLFYLEKLAQVWMEDRREARPGMSYVLEKLPDGYTLWQRPRASNPKQFDKYLYGHPEKRKFDSPARYFRHFQHLMNNNGDNTGCPCSVCARMAGAESSSRSSSSTRTQSVSAPSAHMAPLLAAPTRGRPRTIEVDVGMDTAHVDEEGTPDVYRNLVNKLRRHGIIDQAIKEPWSPDWHAERESFSGFIHSLRQQQQCIPRVGDIILYVKELSEDMEIVQHDTTRVWQLQSKSSGQYLGFPQWEAGLVGQTPSRIPTINPPNQEELSIIYSGLRVEPVAELDSHGNAKPKRHKYVALRQTRPFNLWYKLLSHVEPESWHPSIANALTLASTISLMDKYRFRGSWPNAVIYCRGMYIGSEMVVVGDTVRMLPTVKSRQNTCTEVMVVKSIRLRWSRLDSMYSDRLETHESEIWVHGLGYASNASHPGNRGLGDRGQELSGAASGYPQWSPLHHPTKELAVPFYRILGRLFERDAMASFLGADVNEPLLLDSGREGVVKARTYSREHDQRITHMMHATWYWADNRTDAIGLHAVNGVDTTKHDRERNIKDLRKKTKYLHQLAEDTTPSTDFQGVDMRNFMAPNLSSLPVRKRAHVTAPNREDEEIRHATRIIEDDASTLAKKKARITVLID